MAFSGVSFNQELVLSPTSVLNHRLEVFVLLLLGCAHGEGAVLQGQGGGEAPSEVGALACTVPAADCSMAPWPDGVVNYEFAPSVPPALRSDVEAAMARWVYRSNQVVKFVCNGSECSPPAPLLPGRALISVEPGKTCHSRLGYLGPDGHPAINVARGCPYDHELGHLIGLVHEHQRADRNRHIALSARDFAGCGNGDVVVQCHATSSASDLTPYQPLLSSTMQYQSEPGATLGVRNTGAPCTDDASCAGGVCWNNFCRTPCSSSAQCSDEVCIESFCRPPTLGGPVRVDDGSRASVLQALTLGWKKFRSLGVEARDVPAPGLLPLQPGLPTAITSDPAITTQGGRNLDLFVCAGPSGGTVFHRAMREDRWSPFVDLGGSCAVAPAASAGAVGHLFVAAGDLTDLRLREFVDGAWLAWESLGAPPAGARSGPALIADEASVHVVELASDGNLYRRSRAAGAWTGWQLLLRPPSPASFSGRPALAGQGSSTVLAFGDSASQVRVCGYLVKGSEWTALGTCAVSAAKPGLDLSSAPAVAVEPNARVHVAYRRVDGALEWFTQQDRVLTTARVIGGRPVGSPAMVSGYSGHVDLIALLEDGNLWRREFNRPAARRDYSGDGRDDVVLFRPSERKWYSRLGTFGNSFGDLMSVFPEAPWALVPADYDGDGRVDFATVFLRGAELVWRIRSANAAPERVVKFGSTAFDDAPVPADYDGDGKADIAVFRRASGAWLIRRSSDGTDMAPVYFGQLHDALVPGDYDADGVADLAVVRSEGTGRVWFVRSSRTGQELPGVTFGNATDRLVPADYDGDNAIDFAVFRVEGTPEVGRWLVRSSRTSAELSVSTRASEQDPLVPGDYDGDGKADPTFWNSVTRRWEITRSSDGVVSVLDYGVRSDWLPDAR